MQTVPVITPDWLARPSTEVAPDLVGCTLVRQFPDGQQARGLIVETEAYAPDDPACHAYRRQTPRNRVMFGPAGYSYVYLIYGMYHCFNIVTDVDTVPSAVLIRALQLISLPEEMVLPGKWERLAAGPGKLCRALTIDLSLTALPLVPGQPLWLEPRSLTWQMALDQGQLGLVQTTRIGITQGTELPWRWYLRDCVSVSKSG